MADGDQRPPRTESLPRTSEPRPRGEGQRPRGDRPPGDRPRSPGDQPRSPGDRPRSDRSATDGRRGRNEGPPSHDRARRGGERAGRSDGPRRDDRGGPRESGRGDRGPDRRSAEGPRGEDRHPRGSEAGRAAIATLHRTRHLDLERASDEPLTPQEQREIEQHLAFFRRYKGPLRLAFNAQEDLYVNGSRPVPDRGAAKHLFTKLDRQSIERALQRTELQAPADRARFLAGCVRLIGDAELLVAHLEAVSLAAERAEAAEAFHLTIERIDFGTLAGRTTLTLLGTIVRSFPEQARPRVLFGLLENDSFRARLGEVLGDAEPALRDALEPLSLAHRVLAAGEPPPEDEAGHRALLVGARALLESNLARTLGVDARVRLTELALEAKLGSQPPEPRLRDAIRRLAEGLPSDRPEVARLRRLAIDARLAEGFFDEARAMLRDERAAPRAWLESRRVLVGARRLGEYLVLPEPERPSRLHRAFSLARSAPVLALMGTPRDAADLKFLARLQGELVGLAVVPVLDQGLSPEGVPFVILAQLGERVEGTGGWSRRDRVGGALAAAELVLGLAQRGVVVPDLALARFTSLRPGTLRLADLHGAARDEPGRAPITMAPLALGLVRELLGEDRGLPQALRRKLSREVPLAVLCGALAEAVGELVRDELEREPREKDKTKPAEPPKSEPSPS